MEDNITDSWIQEPDDLIDDYEAKVAHEEYLADAARDDLITNQMDTNNEHTNTK